MESATQQRPIYTGPTGWEVREFSHSQYNLYEGCGKRFEIERIRGYRQKPGASLEFGKAIERSVRLFYSEKRDPIETFEIAWNLVNPELLEGILKEANEKPDSIEARVRAALELQFPNGESWATMAVAGPGLMKNFVATWENYPPRNPYFPDFKKSAIKVRDESTGNDYQTIPDLIDEDAVGKFIADLKSLNGLLDDSVPGLVANDMQLRTQSAATRIFRVALWNFCRKPKRTDPVSPDRIFEEVRKAVGGTRFQIISHVALFAARKANDLTIDAAGEFLGIANPKEINKEWKGMISNEPGLAFLAGDIEKTVVALNALTYKIQWLEATIPQQHAFDAIRQEMSVIPLIQAGWFPRRGGIRFPDNTCTWCPMRGLCMEELFGSRPEYDAITAEETVRWDAKIMDGLD